MEKLKKAILTGISWGVGVGFAIGVFAIVISLLEVAGIGSWDKQKELDCYKKLDKSQCEILYPAN